MMKLTFDISPCPNDTFMFDALVNGRIDTRGFEFDVRYADIEDLNRRALQGGTGVSKISCAILPQIYDRYELLDSGGAMGHGNGPLLVSRPGVDIHAPDMRLVVPGFHTTANLLMERLYPGIRNKNCILFSRVAQSVAAGNFDAGVLIHEGRFTYREHGLVLVADLGVEWEKATGLPLPLGVVVASRRLPEDVRATVGALLRESIEYAFAHPSASRDYVKSHAQEMDDSVIDSHIRLFVNDYSLSLGDTGRRAVQALTGLEI